jgi:cytochrome c oxidase subunit 2
MNRKVHVLSQVEFDTWLADVGEVTVSVETGQQIYQVQCAICHSLDGSAVLGPSWEGLYGSVRNFTDGTSAEADENYIRTSILNPNAQVVTGFQPVMPSFEGRLVDEEIESIILFVQSIVEAQ